MNERNASIRRVALPSGELVSALGMGTWRMGETGTTRHEEIETLQHGLELGISLIDTAEMYGAGRTEELVGDAIAGRRDQAFLVSKVLPHNATSRETANACERSLRRLRTDRIDLYLLHWCGNVPLEETIEAFLSLQQEGKIRYFGVSNLDLGDLHDLWNVPGGASVATDQILYNLLRRGAEWDLLPWLRDKKIPIMAYSPIEQARLVREKRLVNFARETGMTPARVALAWLLASDDVIVLPKTSSARRLDENVRAMECVLTKAQLAELDRLFPPPTHPRPLEMI